MHKKICVVGAGYWGKNHIDTLSQLQSLKGIVDLDQKITDIYKEKYPNINCYDNIDDALKDDYDGFTIATPAETHFDIAKKLILSGKHVLIEKPMALSIEDAEELVQLAKDNKVNVMVGHVLLFHPAIIKIKEMIDSGSIGELQ